MLTGHRHRLQRIGRVEVIMKQPQAWKQLDLPVLAENTSQQARLNSSLRTEIVNLLKLLIDECVTRIAPTKGESDEQDHR